MVGMTPTLAVMRKAQRRDFSMEQGLCAFGDIEKNSVNLTCNKTKLILP